MPSDCDDPIEAQWGVQICAPPESGALRGGYIPQPSHRGFGHAGLPTEEIPRGIFLSREPC